jgi:hypothetical protein
MKEDDFVSGSFRRWGTTLFPLLILALLAGLGCRRELPELFDRNMAPETFITSAPADSLSDSWQVHVHWHGRDTDGEVSYFLWAWTDSSHSWFSAWNPETRAADRILQEGDFNATHLTTATDSIFVLQANEEGGTSRDLTFSVVAVDDKGRRDPVPARLYFTSSVDRRPEIHWIEDAPADLPEGVAWVTTERDTLPAGTPFGCAFYGSTENGYVRGYQWTFGSSPAWYPQDEYGQALWSYSHSDYAGLDSIFLNYENDVAGTEPEMAEYYRYGLFRVKARCIDLAGVESEIDPSPDNPIGVLIPILNEDPDTRLRPLDEAADEFPMKLVYSPFSLGGAGADTTVYPLVEKFDSLTAEGDTLKGFFYRIAEPLPWGEDVELSFNYEGWDRDDPLMASGAEIDSRFQMSYKWETHNLGLMHEPTAIVYGLSLGRYPSGGREGELREIAEVDGFGETEAGFSMNVGPFNYEVAGYAIDHFGRVDGTPALIQFNGGFSSVVDSILLLVKHVEDEQVTESTESVNLTNLDPGDPIRIAIGANVYMSNPASSEWLSWDEASKTATIKPVSVSPMPAIVGEYLITFRVYGHDDVRNGSNAQLGGALWDLTDALDPDNFEQFSDPGLFRIEEGGFLKSWQSLSSSGVSHLGYFDLTFAVEDTVLVLAEGGMSGNILDEETPDELGEKTIEFRFRNTLSTDMFSGLIEAAQQSNLSLYQMGRASDVESLEIRIDYENLMD